MVRNAWDGAVFLLELRNRYENSCLIWYGVLTVFAGTLDEGLSSWSGYQSQKLIVCSIGVG